MGWENVTLSDLPQEVTEPRTFSPLPDGNYTLQLIGAEPNKYREGGLNISTAVAAGTEHAGRRVFIDLPNPDEQPWAKAVLNRMIESMGATVPVYFNAIEELSRIAQNGHSKFSADLYTEHYKSKTGEDKTRNKVNFRSIGAAA